VRLGGIASLVRQQSRSERERSRRLRKHAAELYDAAHEVIAVSRNLRFAVILERALAKRRKLSSNETIEKDG
jgi:hypothetical protein